MDADVAVDPTPAGNAPVGVVDLPDLSDLSDLSAAGLLAVAGQGVRARRAAEVAELRIASQWAVLHGHPERDRDPMTQPGGEGTPAVRTFSLPELAMARETHSATSWSLVADSLDLEHRLPRTRAKVLALECEPWVARKVAVLSRSVPAATVGVVDRAVAAAITGHAPSTVLEIARAKVIEADPQTHAMRKEQERHQRYVSLSRSDEWGYRHIIARVTAGDAVMFDALIDRVADILATFHGHDHNRDELRSMALGWLARPADLLRLLLEHTEASDEELDDTGTEPEEPAEQCSRPVWAPGHLDATLGRLAALSTRQLAALRGRGVLHVHLTDESLRRQSGVARVEGQGPLLVQALIELLGHTDVALKPVLDLAVRTRADAYEHPDVLKDQVWHLAGGDMFPHSPRTATREDIDFDHVVPYQRAGPPGQTGTHNSAPLRRRHHRWKTFGGYRCRQAGPGRYLWQSPHGLCALVDDTGTHTLPPQQAEIILTAPEGVDIYLPETEHGLTLAYDPLDRRVEGVAVGEELGRVS